MIVINGEPDGAFNVDEFCAWAGVRKTRVYEEMKAKRLRVKKFGTRTVIPCEAAREWLQALPDYDPDGELSGRARRARASTAGAEE